MVHPVRLRIHWVSSMDSTPCSCTPPRPIWLAISTTRWRASSRKTPTVTVSWGSRLTMSATAEGAICRGEGAKMKPTAEAPMPTASSASASEVIPQILTNSPSVRAPVPDGSGAHAPTPSSSATAARRSPDRTRSSPTSTAR